MDNDFGPIILPSSQEEEQPCVQSNNCPGCQELKIYIEELRKDYVEFKTYVYGKLKGKSGKVGKSPKVGYFGIGVILDKPSFSF